MKFLRPFIGGLTAIARGACRRSTPLRGECLEIRQALAAVPFGATTEDTAEFMLGEVLVTVVLLESDGSRDRSTEDWTDQEIAAVKQNATAGVTWWEDLLDAQHSVHDLSFQFDWTYADEPLRTGYEPIARPSDDMSLWIDDFFAAADVPAVGSFSDRIRVFNDRQRRESSTHWAFTIFVVDASNDLDKRFAGGGSFAQSFAYAGGRFFVTTSERPASAFAHETGHMFWAVDEYAGGKSYTSRRGYYNTQNTNGSDGNPAPSSRVRSIMDSHEIAFDPPAISPSAREMIGWRDSDADGIFDVLDVPSVLAGTGSFDATLGAYSFVGLAQVSTLDNQNTSGTGHDLTLNQIDEVQVQFGDGPWQTVREYGTYQASLDFTVAVPAGVTLIRVRAVDRQAGVATNVVSDTVATSPAWWHNALNPWDVNGDNDVSPIDALLVINRLNAEGAGELTPKVSGPPYLDSNGDGFLSPLDALLVINQLNRLASVRLAAATPIAEGEPAAYEWLSAAAAAIHLSADKLAVRQEREPDGVRGVSTRSTASPPSRACEPTPGALRRPGSREGEIDAALADDTPTTAAVSRDAVSSGTAAGDVFPVDAGSISGEFGPHDKSVRLS